jgi:hypothetical protein
MPSPRGKTTEPTQRLDEPTAREHRVTGLVAGDDERGREPRSQRDLVMASLLRRPDSTERPGASL